HDDLLQLAAKPDRLPELLESLARVPSWVTPARRPLPVPEVMICVPGWTSAEIFHAPAWRTSVYSLRSVLSATEPSVYAVRQVSLVTALAVVPLTVTSTHSRLTRAIDRAPLDCRPWLVCTSSW